MLAHKTNIGFVQIVVVCGVALLALHPRVFSQSAAQRLPKSHRHIGIEKSAATVIDDFSMTETSPVAPTERENVTRSPNRRYEAFTVSGVRLFIADKTTRKLFEIRGLPIEWRPFSNLVWADNRTLMFDRWSQPHYGVHYAVDVRNKRLIAAAPFPDKVYFDQQLPKKPRK